MSCLLRPRVGAQAPQQRMPCSRACVRSSRLDLQRKVASEAPLREVYDGGRQGHTQQRLCAVQAGQAARRGGARRARAAHARRQRERQRQARQLDRRVQPEAHLRARCCSRPAAGASAGRPRPRAVYSCKRHDPIQALQLVRRPLTVQRAEPDCLHQRCTATDACTASGVHLPLGSSCIARQGSC